MTLVELCAGSAAVSLRALSARARPPLAYQGGKRGYADAILAAMGIQPGGWRGDVVLVEPGPWGEAWEHWRQPSGRADTIERLRAWAEEDPRALWERLRAAPVPAEVGERVATWAVLQFWSFARKPVLPQGARWRTHGAGNIWEPTEWRDRHGNVGSRPASLLPQVAAGLAALPSLSRVTVLRCRAEDVPPMLGAVVYLDPPYSQTTCCYGHDLPRPEVLALAERWSRAGASLVAISEASPLPLPGWHTHGLGAAQEVERTWSKQRREVLTLSRPAAGQMALIA